MLLNIPEKLEADFKWLKHTHGLNDVMFESLLASKEEAQGHISFLKKMVFISNGTVMALGLCLMGWGLRGVTSNLNPLRLLVTIASSGLVLWFCRAFIRGINSVNAAEYVARKHNLI